MSVFRNAAGYLRLLLLSVCLASVCCARTTLLRSPGSSVAPDLLDSTISLFGQDSDGDVVSLCSGVWVSSSDILTAEHCVDTMTRLLKKLDVRQATPGQERGTVLPYMNYRDYRGMWEQPGTTRYATVVAVDQQHDLALLRTGSEPGWHTTVDLAGESPAIGSDIFVVGHPLNMSWTFMTGSVAGYYVHIKTVDVDGPWMQIQSSVNKGNSGGGVFDTSGRLVGITRMTSPAGGIAFAVHLGTIRRFLGR